MQQFSSAAYRLVEHLTNPPTGVPVRDLHFGVVTSKVDLPTICHDKNGMVPNDGTLLAPLTANPIAPADYPKVLPWPPPWPYLSGDLVDKLGKSKLSSLAAIYVREAWSQTRQEYECRVTQFLQSAALALDGRNSGFIRPDSLLVVLLLADREDCSTKNASFWSQGRDPWRMANCGSTFYCYSGSPEFYSVEHYAKVFRSGHPLGRTIIAVTGKAGAPKYVSLGGCKIVDAACGPIKPTQRLSALQQQLGTAETQQVSVHWIDACQLVKYDYADVSTLADKILRTVRQP